MDGQDLEASFSDVFFISSSSNFPLFHARFHVWKFCPCGAQILNEFFEYSKSSRFSHSSSVSSFSDSNVRIISTVIFVNLRLRYGWPLDCRRYEHSTTWPGVPDQRLTRHGLTSEVERIDPIETRKAILAVPRYQLSILRTSEVRRMSRRFLFQRRMLSMQGESYQATRQTPSALR